MVVTLAAGAIIASRDGIPYLDGWFSASSAITAGGLVTLDVSRLSRGSEVILWLLFTCGGVTFTALPPMIWRVWLFRARFRPLIAQAQELTADLAHLRSEEASAAVRLAALLAEAEAEQERRHRAALAKAQAAWAQAGAALHAEEEESPGVTCESAAVTTTEVVDSVPPLSLARPFSFSSEPPLNGLRRVLSFLTGAAEPAPAAPARDHASLATAAQAAAAELTRAAADAASFSDQDAADYVALSRDFEEQNEALVCLIVAVTAFVLAWHVLGAAAFASEYEAAGPHLPPLVRKRTSVAWLSIFLVSSALNNTGLSLLDDSVVSLANRPGALMVLAAAILAGNTAWPVALRVMLRAWVALAEALLGRERAAACRPVRGVRYALEHPQRCYHLLFDARATAAVAFAVVVVTAFQLVFFYATSFDMVNADLDALCASFGVPPMSRAQVGTVIFFQVISVRSAGFQAIDVKRVAHVMGVLWGFMFWFAPHPFVAALNEADESARLGLAAQRDDDETEDEESVRAGGARAPATPALSPRGYSIAVTPPALSARSLRFRGGKSAAGGSSSRNGASPMRLSASGASLHAPDTGVQLHGHMATTAANEAEQEREDEERGRHTLRGIVLRRYVTRHATWIFFAFVTVACAEQKLLSAPPDEPYGRSPTSLFAILFELLSAYGTNGLSFGYPGVNYNLVGKWKPISKLCIILMLFIGRHRNMPRAVDRPLAAHVRSLDSIVRALKTSEAAAARALEELRARLDAAEAAARTGALSPAPSSAANGQASQTTPSAQSEQRMSLLAALEVVRQHEAGKKHDAANDAAAFDI